MRACAVLLCVVLCACAAQQPARVAMQAPPDPKTLMPALENRIFELVDDERHKLDPAAKPLALDSELVGVARQKSADMAARKYFAHLSPDGRTAATLIMENDAGFYGLLGENLAAQPYLPKYGVDVETFARRLVDTWLASQSHRENLADPAYVRTGVGAAVNGDTVYVTELFANDSSLGTGSSHP
jgi:uncharacterized protein YkwD